MISVDEGATYEYVLNDAGEKIKAAGSEANVEEAIGNYVKVDEEGYICIGEYKTSFKYNANVPSMIYNEKRWNHASYYWRSVIYFVNGRFCFQRFTEHCFQKALCG